MKKQILKNRLAALVLFLVPALFIFGFASHPNLGDFSPVRQAAAWLSEIRGNSHLQTAHLLVLLSTPLLVFTAGILRKLAGSEGGLFSDLGYMSVIAGAVILAADKGALCLVPGALDTLDPSVEVQLLPVYQALLDRAGPLWVLNFLFLLPLGFFLSALGLWRSQVLPRPTLILLMISMVLFLNPDIDIVSLTASVLMLAGLAPAFWGLWKGRLLLPQ